MKVEERAYKQLIKMLERMGKNGWKSNTRNPTNNGPCRNPSPQVRREDLLKKLMSTECPKKRHEYLHAHLWNEFEIEQIKNKKRPDFPKTNVRLYEHSYGFI